MKNDIVKNVTNINHLEGAGISIAADAVVQFIVKKVSKEYGEIIGAALGYAATPIIASMLIKNKELRDSVVIGSKTLAIKNLAVKIFEELYSKSLKAVQAEADVTKQASLIKQAALYGKALEVLGVKTLATSSTVDVTTGTDSTLLTGDSSQNYYPYGGENDPTINIKKNDLRAKSGIERY